MCGIIAIAGKAIKFPYNNGFKLLLCAVLDHLLKIGTVVRLSRHRTINICSDNLNAILFSKGFAFAQLTFNRLFSLIIG